MRKNKFGKKSKLSIVSALIALTLAPQAAWPHSYQEENKNSGETWVNIGCSTSEGTAQGTVQDRVITLKCGDITKESYTIPGGQRVLSSGAVTWASDTSWRAVVGQPAETIHETGVKPPVVNPPPEPLMVNPPEGVSGTPDEVAKKAKQTRRSTASAETCSPTCKKGYTCSDVGVIIDKTEPFWRCLKDDFSSPPTTPTDPIAAAASASTPTSSSPTGTYYGFAGQVSVEIGGYSRTVSKRRIGMDPLTMLPIYEDIKNVETASPLKFAALFYFQKSVFSLKAGPQITLGLAPIAHLGRINPAFGGTLDLAFAVKGGNRLFAGVGADFVSTETKQQVFDPTTGDPVTYVDPRDGQTKVRTENTSATQIFITARAGYERAFYYDANHLRLLLDIYAWGTGGTTVGALTSPVAGGIGLSFAPGAVWQKN